MVQDVPSSSNFPHVFIETVINKMILVFNKTHQGSNAHMWFTMKKKHKRGE